MDKEKIDVLTKLIPLLRETSLEYGFWKDSMERDRIRFANAQSKLLEVIRLVSITDLGEEINGNVARAFYYLKPRAEFDVCQILDKIDGLVRNLIISELTGNPISHEEN